MGNARRNVFIAWTSKNCSACGQNSRPGVGRGGEGMDLQSNLDSPDSLGLDEMVRIIETVNINKEQKLIKSRKRHLIVK